MQGSLEVMVVSRQSPDMSIDDIKNILYSGVNSNGVSSSGVSSGVSSNGINSAMSNGEDTTEEEVYYWPTVSSSAIASLGDIQVYKTQRLIQRNT